jgi:hypothetical protein
MDNQDAGIPHPHHVAIDTDPRTTRALFTGRLVDGVATVTGRVPRSRQAPTTSGAACTRPP